MYKKDKLKLKINEFVAENGTDTVMDKEQILTLAVKIFMTLNRLIWKKSVGLKMMMKTRNTGFLQLQPAMEHTFFLILKTENFLNSTMKMRIHGMK